MPLAAAEADCLISASLSSDGAGPVRGHLDTLDFDCGIEGWVLDLTAPGTPLSVELMVGGNVIAECVTMLARHDIAGILGGDMTPGFRFEPETLQALRRLAPAHSAAEIRLRVAGTPWVLPSTHDVRTLEDLLGRAPVTAGHDVAFSLMVRLSTLRGQAAGLLDRPLRPLSAHMAGFIEALAIDQGGLVWALGWMRRGVAVDAPVVIVDQQKIPAALAFTLFERPDVGAGMCGFVGVLYSDWRPTSTSQVHLYIDPHTLAHLHTGASPRLIAIGEFHDQFRRLLPTCHTGHTAAMQRMLMLPDSWTVMEAMVGAPARATLDQVLVLPGFGALVSGWALSPLKPIESFALRLGQSIIDCDRQSVFFCERPDLAGVFPGNDRLLATAGFVATFRGHLAAGDVSDPVLKIRYADHTTSNHRVEMLAVRLLEQAVSIAAATTLYPSLAAENFFPDFAAAIRDNARQAIRPCRAFATAPSEQAVVMVVPEDRSDTFLLFNELEFHLCRQKVPFGIVLVAGTSHRRTDVVSLFRSLAAIAPAPCSLFFTETPDYALHVLADVLAATRTAQFAFVGAGLYLTDAGWQAVSGSLEQPNAALTMLEIEDPAAPDLDRTLSAQGFMWSAAAFSRWIDQAPVLLHGGHDINPFGTAALDGPVHRKAVRRAAVPSVSPVVRAINQLAIRA